MALGQTLTNAEILEYFRAFFARGGISYKDKVSGLSTALQSKVGSDDVIDVLASALESPDWNTRGNKAEQDMKKRILNQLRSGSDGVLGKLPGEDAKFVEEHQGAYKIIVRGNQTTVDPNFDTNNDILNQKIAESKTARDTAAAENKATKEQRQAELDAVNKTEVTDYVRSHLNDPADPSVQAFKDIMDRIHPPARGGHHTPAQYNTFLSGYTNDAQLIDAMSGHLAGVNFTPEFLSKIMTSGTYKYPELMNTFAPRSTRYFRGDSPTPAYANLQTNFGNVRTNTLAPLGVTPLNTAAIAASADGYNALVETLPDSAQKTAYTTAVADARTKEEAARTAAAERTAAVANANPHSVIDFVRENYNDESMGVYRNMVDGFYIARGARLTPPITSANLNQRVPGRYTEFFTYANNDAKLIIALNNYMGSHRTTPGRQDLGSPALLAQILTSDTYKYEELLGAPGAATTAAFNAIHDRFGNVCRNEALSPLTLDEKDTLFINYNLQELTAIIDANPADPRNATYKDILQRQGAAFDSLFPADKYPNGIADPAVKQMLQKMKFNRYRKGANNNINAVKHNLNALIGPDGADTMIECMGAYGNTVNAAYGRKTLPGIAGDTALIAQNKLLEVMCKKNGMNKRETDAVMRKTANFNNEGMASIGSLIGLGLKNFMPALATSTLITAVSTVNPLAGAAVGVGFAAHSMWKMGMGEFNAAKERLMRNGVEPTNREVWADARANGMIGRMVRQGIPTLVAFIGPSLPIIGPFLRANPHALPLAFAAKAGLAEGTRSYNQGATLFQSILRGAAAGTGGYLGGRLGRFTGSAVGNSFNEGYEAAGIKEGEGLLGAIRGGLSGLKNIGSDIAKAPGAVMAGLGIAGAGGAAALTDKTDTAGTGGARTGTAGTRTDSAGRQDSDWDGYDDRYQSWANKNSNPETMFKGGRYVNADGEAINPHAMNVKPGSFRWVANGSEQSAGTGTTTGNANSAVTSAKPEAEVKTVIEYRDRPVVDGKYNAEQETALETELAQTRAALNAATARLEKLDIQADPGNVKTSGITPARPTPIQGIVPWNGGMGAFGENAGLNVTP